MEDIFGGRNFFGLRPAVRTFGVENLSHRNHYMTSEGLRVLVNDLAVYDQYDDGREITVAVVDGYCW